MTTGLLKESRLVRKRPHRRIILTHWNASAFQRAELSRVLTELVIYPLLYDDVLIREEDLLTNRPIIRMLSEPGHLHVFQELLAAGLIKLLRLPIDAYPLGRQFDPVRQPISARAEEHQLRRSYKGRQWKPTASEWKFFEQLDAIIAQYPTASRFHAPFSLGNPFAAELAELLENREKYRLAGHPVFRYIHPKAADKFSQFCHDPEAWQRFLRDQGVKSTIIGPDGGFYRTAAYQCSYLLPAPRAMQRLVESVYAAVYCDREDSEGRYSGSKLIELPYSYESDAERETAAETISKIEIVPTSAAASIAFVPGIASVLARTRESAAFECLQKVLQQLGTVPDPLLPTEVAFREAWSNICGVYADHFARFAAKESTADEKISKYTIFAYLLARVFGFIMLPEGPQDLHLPVAGDKIVEEAIKHWAPSLLKGFRAMLRIPIIRQSAATSVDVRFSKVLLNKKLTR